MKKETSQKVIHGDCLVEMKKFPDKSFDLVLTDPPYFLPAKHYSTRKDFARSFADLGVLDGFFRMFFDEINRILKDDGVFYIFCDGQSYPLFYYYSYFISKNVRPLVWDKKVSFNGYDWRHQHEIIIFGERKDKKPIPTGNGDILRFNAVKVDIRQHPAEKPVDLLKELLLKHLREDGIVLDPFLGSGSTLVAAKQLNRNAVGIEISEEYCEIARQRLAQSILL